MRKLYTTTYSELSEKERTVFTKETIDDMKEIIGINDLFVCNADDDWTTVTWNDQDGYTHIIPMPASRVEIFESRGVAKELYELYNSLYSFGMLTRISALTTSFEKRWNLDVYQFAGTLMAGSLSIHWAKCYMGPLMALCAYAHADK